MEDDVDTRTLWEVAFDYEREVIDPQMCFASDEARERGLRYLNHLILPLVGHVRMCDVDEELEKGVGVTLWHQADDYGPTHVWKDFLRVTRLRFESRRLSS